MARLSGLVGATSYMPGVGLSSPMKLFQIAKFVTEAPAESGARLPGGGKGGPPVKSQPGPFSVALRRQLRSCTINRLHHITLRLWRINLHS
jgi:hypothetical protein